VTMPERGDIVGHLEEFDNPAFSAPQAECALVLM